MRLVCIHHALPMNDVAKSDVSSSRIGDEKFIY